jgi:hypothetical protein
MNIPPVNPLKFLNLSNCILIYPKKILVLFAIIFHIANFQSYGQFTISPQSLLFDASLAGTTASQTFTVKNTGKSKSDAVTVRDWSWQNDGAAVTGVTPIEPEIDAGGSQVFTVSVTYPVRAGSSFISLDLDAGQAYVGNVQVTVITDYPAAPENLIISNGNLLSWSATEGASGYKIYIDNTLVGSTTSVTYAVFGLQSGHTYSLGVSAYNATGESQRSTISYTPPNPPTQLVATNITISGCKLSWNAPVGTVTSGYKVYRDHLLISTINSSTTTFYTVTGLNSATRYLFTVSAFNNATGGEAGTDLYVTTIPDPVSNLSLSNITGTGCTLSWTAPAGSAITGYKIYKDQAAPVPTSTTTYPVSGLDPSTAYTFYVSAYSAGGESIKKSILVNSPPSGVSAKNITSVSLNLFWSASAGAVSYKVYKGTDAPSTTANTNLNVGNLQANTVYNFQVSMIFSGGGESSKSTNFSVITSPVSPTNLTATNISGTGLTLSWTASPGANTYLIYDNGNFLTGSSTPSVVITGLIPYSSHSFTIIALNTSAAITCGSDPTAPLVITLTDPPCSGTPAAPTNLISNGVTDTEATLWWTAPPQGASGYKIYNGTTLVLTVTIPYARITGLNPNTSYSYTVSALCNTAESPKSTVLAVKTAASSLNIPPTPGGLVATNVTSTGVTLTWSGVANANAYWVYNKGSFFMKSTTAPTTTLTLSNLTPNTTYLFSIVAMHTSSSPTANSGASNVVKVVTPNSGRFSTAEGYENLQEAQLFQNYPNPSERSTSIGFYLPENVRNSNLTIYNNEGRLIRTVPIHERGSGELTINKGELSPGLYLYALETDGKKVSAKRMMID